MIGFSTIHAIPPPPSRVCYKRHLFKEAPLFPFCLFKLILIHKGTFHQVHGLHFLLLGTSDLYVKQRPYPKYKHPVSNKRRRLSYQYLVGVPDSKSREIAIGSLLEGKRSYSTVIKMYFLDIMSIHCMSGRRLMRT